MKKLILIIYLLVIAIAIYAQQTDFPKLTGPYLGQKPPGMSPEIFAPGIVSIPNSAEFSGTFSPDGSEYYFYRISKNDPDKIFFSKLKDGKWTAPASAAFAEGYPAYLITKHCFSHGNILIPQKRKGSQGFPACG